MAVSELLFGPNITGFRDTLEGAVAYNPLGCLVGRAWFGVGLPFRQRSGGTVEQNDGVGRRFTGLRGGTEGAGLDPFGLGAVLIAWSITFATLVSAPAIMRVLKQRGSRAVERLMGMLLVMLSVQMFLNGLTEYFRHH